MGYNGGNAFTRYRQGAGHHRPGGANRRHPCRFLASNSTPGPPARRSVIPHRRAPRVHSSRHLHPSQHRFDHRGQCRAAAAQVGSSGAGELNERPCARTQERGAGFHLRPYDCHRPPLLFPFRVTELLLLRCLHWSVTLREELGALECSPLAATHHSAVSPHQRRAKKRKEPLAQHGTRLSHTFLLRERSSQSALGPSPPRNSMLPRLPHRVKQANCLCKRSTILSALTVQRKCPHAGDGDVEHARG